MEAIALNRKFLKLFGMCLDDESASHNDRIVSKFVNWIMLAISICTVAISIEYIISHFQDTESILYAVMQVSANTASGGGYWTFYEKKFQVAEFFGNIEHLVEKRKIFKFTSSQISFLKFMQPERTRRCS